MFKEEDDDLEQKKADLRKSFSLLLRDLASLDKTVAADTLVRILEREPYCVQQDVWDVVFITLKKYAEAPCDVNNQKAVKLAQCIEMLPGLLEIEKLS